MRRSIGRGTNFCTALSIDACPKITPSLFSENSILLNRTGLALWWKKTSPFCAFINSAKFGLLSFVGSDLTTIRYWKCPPIRRSDNRL